MLDNVGRLLRAVGLDYADVVKCTVYLDDFDEFAAMNAIYREIFRPIRRPGDRRGQPARPWRARIEIEVAPARDARRAPGRAPSRRAG